LAKQGMRRYNTHKEKEKFEDHNSVAPVPEIKGKAKHGKEKARPIIEGTQAPAQKVFHSRPHEDNPVFEKPYIEDPIPPIYGAIDNDLARDNLQNDMSKADMENL
jgi:hypothetical protein